MHVLGCGQELREPLVQGGRLQPLLLGQEGVSLGGRRGNIADGPALGEGAEVVEEVLQLVHLGQGHQAVEGDRVVGAALGPVRGEVEGVAPVAVEHGDGAGDEHLLEGVTVEAAAAKVVPRVQGLQRFDLIAIDLI